MTEVAPARRPWIVLLVIAVVAGGIWAVVTLNDPARGPRSAVAGYLAAVEEGDAEAALARIDTDAGTLACAEVVSTPVYSAVADRPSDARITGVEVLQQGDTGPSGETVGETTAWVDVTYTAGGEEGLEAEVVAVKTGDGWRLASDAELGLGTTGLALEAPGALTLDGVCAVEAAQLENLRVLPGTYDVEYVDAAGVAAAEPVQVVAPARGASVLVQPEPTAAVVEAVTDRVNAWMTECLATGITGPTCPAESTRITRVLDVTGGGGPGEELEVVVQAVAPRLDVAGQGWWRYDTVAPGVVTVQGTLREDACGPTSIGCTPGAATTDVTVFSYSGSVEVGADGEVVLGD